MNGVTVERRRGANRDSRGAHAQKKDRNATVFGRIRIGPGQKQHPVNSMGSARPDLLTADDKVVAIFDRASGQPGEVGAGVRLREALTPALKSRMSWVPVPMSMARMRMG